MQVFLMLPTPIHNYHRNITRETRARNEMQLACDTLSSALYTYTQARETSTSHIEVQSLFNDDLITTACE